MTTDHLASPTTGAYSLTSGTITSSPQSSGTLTTSKLTTDPFPTDYSVRSINNSAKEPLSSKVFESSKRTDSIQAVSTDEKDVNSALSCDQDTDADHTVHQVTIFVIYLYIKYGTFVLQIHYNLF